MEALLKGSKEGYKSVEDDATFQNLVNPADPQERLCITGYKDNPIKRWLFYAVTVTLGGLPWLVMKWYPQLNAIIMTRISLKDANGVLVKDSTDTYSIHHIRCDDVFNERCTNSDSVLTHVPELREAVRSFQHHHVKYVWHPVMCHFQALRGWDSGEKTVHQLLEDSNGLTEEEEMILLKYYGKNQIDVEVKSHWEMFTSEVIHPFYLFQLFSITLWCFDEYHHYGICVLIITCCSIAITLKTARAQQISLRETVERSRVDEAHVVRPDGATCCVHASQLVPGDVIEVPPQGCVMPCDAVLLNGLCIVNESTLTGESAPTTKTPPPMSTDKFDSFLFKRHTLYCGTKVLQTRYYGDHKVTAVVINTGFCTAKGELIRSILHPKPLGFKFYEDSVRFVAALFGLAAVGITYLVAVLLSRGVDVETIILNSLDLITIVVPPALPAAMTSGIINAQSRLRQKGIFCTSPARINIAGKLKLFCFDKTGTLTEEGLDMWAAMPVDKQKRGLKVQYTSLMNPRDHFAVAMATCHSLTSIGGHLIGDPLDVSIFNAINWELEEIGSDSTRYDMLCPTIVRPRLKWSKPHLPVKNPGRVRTLSVPASDTSKPIERRTRSGSLTPTAGLEDSLLDDLPYEIGIVRQFPFSSASQSMSVITRALGCDHMVLYIKGAPEKILELCLTSTVPDSVHDELTTFTSGGYRVIALACRILDRKFTWRKSQKARREELETELTFLGLIILRNNLKPNTTSVIQELHDADIRSVMVTGDSLLTAISVSRECGMVMPEDMVVQVVVTIPSVGDGAPQLTYEPMGVTSESLLPSDINKYWHYAIDGRNFALLRMHFAEMLANIIVRGTVFARMLPEQKTQLIEAFQDLNYIVGMCGDGANDCGAMKAAHIGISLSEAENSVAAPFTCNNRDLSCVSYLMKEGRCALVTSFVIFKYMAVYSLIQFFTVLILYTLGVVLSTWEFLYVDLFITSSLAVVIGRTGPTNVLHKTRPLAKLFCASNLVPLFLEIILILLILLSSLYCLSLQSWFTPVVPSDEEITTTWENTVLYSVSCFQYLILALVYSKGKPHCQPFFTDFLFVFTWTFLCIMTTILCAHPSKFLSEWFELVPTTTDTSEQAEFRVLLLLFPVFNLTVSFLIESSVAQRKWLKNLLHFILQKKKPKNRYKQVLSENLTWKRAWEADSVC